MDVKAMKMMIDQGKTVSEIAKELGCNRRNIYWTCAKLGIQVTRPKYEIEVDRIKEMIETGFTVRKIAEELGCTENYIYVIMKRNGLHTKRALQRDTGKSMKEIGKEISRALAQNEKRCSVCKKIFYTYNLCEYAYKRNGKIFCSWNCYRKVYRDE